MSEYNNITEKCRSINQEREALIDRKRKLTYELRVISERLKVLDDNVESLYAQQEEHWPGYDHHQDIDDEIVKAFFNNPDITQKGLADLMHTPLYLVNEHVDRFFKMRKG